MTDFYNLSEKEVLAELKVTERGLSSEEAASRLKIYGPNTIHEEAHVHPFVIFLGQFKSPIVWILIGAMIISFIVDEMVDFYVIGAIVILNAILGFVQEYRAECAIEALKKMISLKAVVLRDGSETHISAEEVVPGDVLVINTGDELSADARLLSIVNLRTQEASLTGESSTVQKNVSALKGEYAVADRKNIVYAGTTVTNGHGRAVVVGTAMHTEFGKIAKMIQETKPDPTPLQKKLKRLGAYIGILVVIVAVLVFLVGMFKLDQP